MNKTIVIEMLENKDIKISRNGQNPIMISSSDRSIGADDMFGLFDYSAGDTFEIIKKNESKKDTAVLDYFYDLIKDISEKITTYEDDNDEIPAYKID